MICRKTGVLLALLLICICLAGQGNILAQANWWSPLLHNNTGNGVNGNVYAITSYQNNVVVAGGFSLAGGVSARNIAMWNGNTWTALGSGIGNSGDSVYALAVYNGDLYAGGNFSSAGGNSASNIARWNGTAWSSLTTGVDGEVKALLVFNSTLVVGGDFEDRGNKIAVWNGSAWSTFGPGFNSSGGSKVLALAIFNSQLIAAGRLQQSGPNNFNNIASWNGTSWLGLGSGIGGNNDRVFALTVFNSTLVAGGKFSAAGGNTANYLARWTGSVWQSVGNTGSDLDDEVDALSSYNNELIVGGNFKFISGLYASRIAKWNGSSWSRLISGPDDKVNALFTKDTSLYAGGEFSYAGGIRANYVARYYNQTSHSVSGRVFYSDNSTPVTSGKVKAFMVDSLTRELIVVDSAAINSNGNYDFPNLIHGTLRVLAFPNDELDFVPTFFPSTIDWRTATIIVPTSNLTNVDISVFRVAPEPLNLNASATISGHIYLNFTVPGNPTGSYPYQKDAILYVKLGNSFKRFSVSTDNETYTTSSLAPGIYDLYVFRSGYTAAFRTDTLGTNNQTNIDFYLDTLNLIGLHNISETVPKEFSLGQNYPNPFNPSTSIRFSILKQGFVSLAVYNVLGQEVIKLVNEDLRPGDYKFIFDAGELPSGIYFYTLQTSSFAETRKMILIK